jgi:hypothetical protein
MIRALTTHHYRTLSEESLLFVIKLLMAIVCLIWMFYNILRDGVVVVTDNHVLCLDVLKYFMIWRWCKQSITCLVWIF